MVISGEAGVGKTSLLHAAAAALSDVPGPRIEWLWGTCEPMLSPTPLGALVDWLDRMPPTLAAAVRAGRQTGEVLAGVLALLRDAARPKVVVVDDAQWADSATLDLLRYISRRIEGTRALLILSHRDDALALDHPLLGVLAGLPASRALRIVLQPLTPTGVAALAQRAGRSASGLYATTQGNPFFITELLAGPVHVPVLGPAHGPAPGSAGAHEVQRGSEAGGHAQNVSVHSGAVQTRHPQPLPASVRDAVLARIAPLPATARDVIELASVSPTPLEIAVLDAVVDDAQAAITLCTAAGLLLTDGTALRFRHELARRAVEAALPPGRAAALHAAVFDALSLRGGAPLTRLVHHAAQAGLSGAVRRLAPEAARAAVQASAHRQAAGLFALALEHAAGLPAAERAALFAAHSLACQHIQRTDDALVSRSAALALHRQLDNRLQIGRDLCELAVLRRYREGPAAALPLVQEAIDLLQTQDAPQDLATAYTVMGNALLNDATSHAAARWSEKALALLEGQPDAHECRTYALNILAAAQLRGHDQPAAWVQLQSSLDTALVHRLDSHAANAYLLMTSFKLMHRHLGEAAVVGERGSAFCEARDLDIYRVPFLVRLGHIDLEAGQWDAADARVLAIRQTPALDPVDAELLAKLEHVINLRRGRAGSDAYWTALIDGPQDVPLGLWVAPLPVACCEAAWLRGDNAAVQRIAKQALGLAVATGEGWRIGQLACWLQRAGGVWPADVPTPSTALPPPCQLELDGDLAAAAQAWGQLGCGYQQALVLMLGNVGDQAGDQADDQAGGDAAHLLQALALLDALGAEPAARLARRRLRALGVRDVPRGRNAATRVDPLGLTGREREVLDLLSQQLSNREIAARLHRSERTVENHVAALIGKLGATSRHDAVLRAASAHQK